MDGRCGQHRYPLTLNAFADQRMASFVSGQQLFQCAKLQGCGPFDFFWRGIESASQVFWLGFSQNGRQRCSLQPVFGSLLWESSAIGGGVQFVPDQSGGLRQVKGNAMPAGQQRGRYRVGEQVVVMRNGLSRPGQLGNLDDVAQGRARRQNVHPQTLNPRQLDPCRCQR